MRLACGVCAIVAMLSLGACLFPWAIRGHRSGRPEADTPQSRAQARLLQLAADMEPALARSRRILLGQRGPGEPTCYTQQLDGNRILLQGSPTGGAGLRIMAVYAGSPDGPLALYRWSQEQLRPFLEAERKANAPALAGAEELADAARELASEIGAGFDPLSLNVADGRIISPAWPAECLRRLRTAIAAGDASSAQVWADELAAATFALADFHRWLNLLLDSHLASLEFQARCRVAFVWADSVDRTINDVQESCLPAAGTMIAWGQNYLKVEYQAERLFEPVPQAAAIVTSSDLSATPAARWMPPKLRGAFLSLRSHLSTTGQAVWDRAAAAPYQRSYLANMLWGAICADSLDKMGLTLQRLDQSHMTVTKAELMDVLFHRAGLYSSGYRWADRYDPRIIDAAGRIGEDRELVARRAHQLTNRLLAGWKNYEGDIMTLAEALDAMKLDCVRGTDMIGALYRNAGQGEYFLVRLRCGVAGHSVGLVPVERDGRRDLLILDSLDPDPPGKTWPCAYFEDFSWPNGYPGERGPVFAAELYVRGLDGYVFAEGYVVRGEHAGELVRAPLPHLPDPQQAGVINAFAGPYPPVPTATP